MIKREQEVLIKLKEMKKRKQEVSIKGQSTGTRRARSVEKVTTN